MPDGELEKGWRGGWGFTDGIKDATTAKEKAEAASVPAPTTSEGLSFDADQNSDAQANEKNQHKCIQHLCFSFFVWARVAVPPLKTRCFLTQCERPL
jgi:hypothetical protein